MKTEIPLHHFPATTPGPLTADSGDAWTLFFAKCNEIAERVRARRHLAETPEAAPAIKSRA